MRIAIEIDEATYELYTSLDAPITLPFEKVRGAILIYDTDTKEWTWAAMPDDVSGKNLNITSEDLRLDLLYRTPIKSNLEN